MAFEDMDTDKEENLEETPSQEGSGNRTFFIVAGILGGIMLLSLICLAVYALVVAPQRRNQQAAQVAQINAQNTQIARAAQETELAAKWTATPTATKLLPTATASPTPVLAVPTGASPSPTIDRTATVAALLTEAAAGKLTQTPTASGLPDTGFAEDVGVPALVGLALLLIAVIFLARRLRAAS